MKTNKQATLFYERTARPITNCYAVVSFNIAGGAVGGLVFSGAAAQVEESYWDAQATGVNVSPGGGAPRNTAEMTHPYDPDTYVRWDFDNIWSNDIEEVYYARLEWEAVQNANSYKIFAAVNPGLDFEEWQQVGHVDVLYFEDAINLETNHAMFYRVVATTAPFPDGRGERRRRIDQRNNNR